MNLMLIDFAYFIFTIIIEINKCHWIHLSTGNNPEFFVAIDIIATNIFCNRIFLYMTLSWEFEGLSMSTQIINGFQAEISSN